MSVPVHKPSAHLSISDAATAIIALINSSPHSPRADEIEAIVAKAAAPPSESDVVAVQQLDEFRRLKAALHGYVDDPNRTEDLPDDDPEYHRLDAALDAFATEVWARPPLTWGDVLMRGELALYHENGLMTAACEPDAYLDEKAAAQLIDAIITVGRRAFGQSDDGRREGDV